MSYGWYLWHWPFLVIAEIRWGPLVGTQRIITVGVALAVAGFSLRILRDLRRRLGDRLLTNMSPIEVFGLRVFGWARRALRCAQVPVRYHGATIVDERFIERAHRRGIPVHVWTIDERAEMERLLDLGVDGIMTDDVETLRDVLTARGEWVT